MNTDHFYFFYEEMSSEAFYTFFKLNCLSAVVLKLQLLFYIFWILLSLSAPEHSQAPLPSFSLGAALTLLISPVLLSS